LEVVTSVRQEEHSLQALWQEGGQQDHDPSQDVAGLGALLQRAEVLGTQAVEVMLLEPLHLAQEAYVSKEPSNHHQPWARQVLSLEHFLRWVEVPKGLLEHMDSGQERLSWALASLRLPCEAQPQGQHEEQLQLVVALAYPSL
jgi:hypothetical protein